MHFFRKVDIAALNKRNGIAVLQCAPYRRGIVCRAPHTADDDVIEGKFLGFIRFRLFVNALNKVERFAVYVGCFRIERHVASRIAVCNHIARILPVDGRHRKRRRVRGRRTDRAAVGIGGKVGSVSAAVAGAVIVARRNDKADARIFDFFVYAFYKEVALLQAFFRGKARARTKRHVNHVYAQRYAVFERGEDIHRVCPADHLAV